MVMILGGNASLPLPASAAQALLSPASHLPLWPHRPLPFIGKPLPASPMSAHVMTFRAPRTTPQNLPVMRPFI